MTNVDTMSRHPADETLAAFVDGRLGAAEGDQVIEHLASCDDCRSLFDMIGDVMEAEGIEREPLADPEAIVDPEPAVDPQPVIERAPAVVPGRFGRRAVISLLAAAAAVAVVFTPPVQERIESYRTGGVSRLVKASESLSQRDLESRLAGGFPYKELKRTNRGPDDGPFDLEKTEIFKVMAELEDRPSAKELRALGVGQLLLARNEKDVAAAIEGAIATLERALKAAGGNDPDLLNDLSAAYIDLARWTSDAQAAGQALNFAERSWGLKKSSEAAWNRALALEKLNRREDALKAWQQYLAIDSSSPWAAEVRNDRIPDLQEQQP